MPAPGTVLRLLQIAIFMAALYPGAMASGQSRLIEFKGICNASGAVAVDDDTILVGDDEVSALSMLRLITGQLSGPKIPLPASYGLKEADIEAGTILGDRVVWISSHGRNSKGEPQARSVPAVRVAPDRGGYRSARRWISRPRTTVCRKRCCSRAARHSPRSRPQSATSPYPTPTLPRRNAVSISRA